MDTTTETVFYELAKNYKETIRITSTVFNGHLLTGLRVYVENKDGLTIPTRKGITLRPETWQVLLPELQKAIPKPDTADTLDRVVQLVSEGLKPAEIAKRLNVNRSTVGRCIKKALAEGMLQGDVA
jgi:hypothetical protein